jgi:2-dehydropantoate 2-reductase
MSAPGGRETAEQALTANVEIATREGHAPTPDSVQLAHSRLTDPKGQWSASMMRDMEAGRPVEADHVIGWMLEKARVHGVATPLLTMAYTHLKTYERRRGDGRLPVRG